MDNGAERRTSRRYTMALPVTIRANGRGGELRGKTRDVSFRGLYFMTDADCDPGSEIEFILTLPKEITLATDVNIHCFGQVVRVETQDAGRGVAARIDRYEFMQTPA
jgi:PilZ domain-containing protein